MARHMPGSAAVPRAHPLRDKTSRDGDENIVMWCVWLPV